MKLLLKMLGPSFFQSPPVGVRAPRLAVGVLDDPSLPCTPVQGLAASCGDPQAGGVGDGTVKVCCLRV